MPGESRVQSVLWQGFMELGRAGVAWGAAMRSRDGWCGCQVGRRWRGVMAKSTWAHGKLRESVDEEPGSGGRQAEESLCGAG